ncbi:MAG: rod shape-determining protein MreC [Myxococcales bacterium]|nr:rod shape-determining protein MreC [Myxococcales bacterium]
MRDILRKYRDTATTLVVLILPLFSMYFHGKVRDNSTVFERTLVALTAPAQRVAALIVGGIQDVWTEYINLVGLQAANEELRNENQILLGEALRAKKLKLENQRLKSLLGFRERYADLKTVPARVIAKDISPYYRVVKIVLDAGRSDAVSEGMPVVTHEGVVGRISRATGNFSEVMLAVDSRSNINVTIAGKGVSGVLRGVGDKNDFGGSFRFLHQSEPVEQNDTVVTSGHDKVFPAGLEVGYIASATVRQNGLYYEYDVNPAVNFSTLEEVLVIVEREREPDLENGGENSR